LIDVLVFNATLSLWVEEAGVSDVASSTPGHERGSNSQVFVVIGTDYTGSYTSKYHTIMTTTDPGISYG